MLILDGNHSDGLGFSPLYSHLWHRHCMSLRVIISHRKSNHQMTAKTFCSVAVACVCVCVTRTGACTWVCTACLCWSRLFLLEPSCKSGLWCSWTSRSDWPASLEALGQVKMGKGGGEEREGNGWRRTTGGQIEEEVWEARKRISEGKNLPCSLYLCLFFLTVICPLVMFLTNWCFFILNCVRACVVSFGQTRGPCQHSSSRRTQGSLLQCHTEIRIPAACVCLCFTALWCQTKPSRGSCWSSCASSSLYPTVLYATTRGVSKRVRAPVFTLLCVHDVWVRTFFNRDDTSASSRLQIAVGLYCSADFILVAVTVLVTHRVNS